MKEFSKAMLFFALTLSMVGAIGWIFHKSEPVYINHPDPYHQLELYDVVTIRPYGNLENWLDVAMVVQMDTTSLNNDYAVVKSLKWGSEFKDIPINKEGAPAAYKVIGRGTFYHKVNSFIGFNIMFITALLIAILAVIMGIATYDALDDWMYFRRTRR